ncbi:hypothetical protein [Pseudomonas typographi]|uniref:hypothetical protein n=1 Tax=Pseudomonas typographi TaxID=2715964 RepID=UPI0016864298|nr:hypothetical protein [Pseudomonas typographi]MBD1590309.1 hypothetical protein [Pseudomonas typographi]
MPRITVTTTVRTVFEVPEGLSIEQIRHQALPDLAEPEEETDSIAALQQHVMNQVYLGGADDVYISIEHAIVDGDV